MDPKYCCTLMLPSATERVQAEQGEENMGWKVLGGEKKITKARREGENVRKERTKRETG